MKNWKTTCAGIAIALVAALANQHVISTDLAGLIGGGLTLLLGAFSKDATTPTTPATPSA